MAAGAWSVWTFRRSAMCEQPQAVGLMLTRKLLWGEAEVRFLGAAAPLPGPPPAPRGEGDAFRCSHSLRNHRSALDFLLPLPREAGEGDGGRDGGRGPDGARPVPLPALDRLLRQSTISRSSSGVTTATPGLPTS